MIIAIDYDGTISATNHEKVKWIATHLGKTVSPWECNRTNCVPIIGIDAYTSMGAFVYERESTLQADEVPGALDALRVLSRKAQLYVVTARPQRRIPFAREWLETHGVLSCVKDVRSSEGSSKAAVCSALDAGILIDDDLRHLRDAKAGRLVRVLLQHGREGQFHSRQDISFCRNWGDVLQLVERIG